MKDVLLSCIVCCIHAQLIFKININHVSGLDQIGTKFPADENIYLDHSNLERGMITSSNVTVFSDWHYQCDHLGLCYHLYDYYRYRQSTFTCSHCMSISVYMYMQYTLSKHFSREPSLSVSDVAHIFNTAHNCDTFHSTFSDNVYIFSINISVWQL